MYTRDSLFSAISIPQNSFDTKSIKYDTTHNYSHKQAAEPIKLGQLEVYTAFNLLYNIEYHSIII